MAGLTSGIGVSNITPLIFIFEQVIMAEQVGELRLSSQIFNLVLGMLRLLVIICILFMMTLVMLNLWQAKMVV